MIIGLKVNKFDSELFKSLKNTEVKSKYERKFQ